MYVLNPALGLRVGFWTKYNQDRISIHNVKSGGSKGELKPNWDTKGLPKVINNYGSRGIVVPVMGRVPGINLLQFSTSKFHFKLLISLILENWS